MAIALELLADFGAASALPDDGVVDRAAGVLVPDHGGFTLVGDADGRDLVVVQSRLRQGFDHHRTLGGEDFHRVMFDPAGLRIMLRELALGGADHVGVAIENDRARAGRTLIEGNDVVLVLSVGHVDCLGRNRGVKPGARAKWAGSRTKGIKRFWACRQWLVLHPL
ncbi:hypothetical protein D3C76_628050 [compost metagenome]